MDRKELYLNVRKAFRLVYEVQDSIFGMVEYIGSKIKHDKYAGAQLFADQIVNYKPKIDEYADQRFGGKTWTWAFFPTFMYIYYFQGKNKGVQKSSFSIVQVIDDGCFKALGNTSIPSTKDFKKPEDSESYLLFAFSIWKDNDYIWFYRNEKREELDEREGILKISESIKNNRNEPYVVSNDNTSSFIVKRVNLESIGSKEEADQVLQDFAKLVLDKTGYQLLLEDPK